MTSGLAEFNWHPVTHFDAAGDNAGVTSAVPFDAAVQATAASKRGSQFRSGQRVRESFSHLDEGSGMTSGIQ